MKKAIRKGSLDVVDCVHKMLVSAQSNVQLIVKRAVESVGSSGQKLSDDEVLKLIF